MEFSETTKGLGMGFYSPSKLKVAKQCGFRFVKQYIEKAKPTNEVDMTKAGHGTNVHAVLEQVMRLYKEGQLDPALGAIRELVDKELGTGSNLRTAQETLDLESLAPSIATMAHRILVYAQRTRSHLYIEKTLGIRSDFTPTASNFDKPIFVGIIDLGLVSPDGLMTILDHKTGYMTMQGHEFQLLAYEILGHYCLAPFAKASLGIDVKAVRTGLNFIAEEQILWRDTVPVGQISTEKRKEFTYYVNKDLESAALGLVSRGKHCNYCGFRSYCGSKVGTRKKKTVEADTTPSI